MGNSRVDKSEDFLNSGMRLITETDADGLLDAARKRRISKRREELYSIPEDRYERHCGGAGGFDDFIEGWTD
jgi:hypothetical protein